MVYRYLWPTAKMAVLIKDINAVFVGNDRMAIGLMQGLSQQGYHAGQVLKLQGVPSQTVASQPEYYVIKSRDALSKIAVKFEKTVSQLQAMNNIPNPNKNYDGQKIRVK